MQLPRNLDTAWNSHPFCNLVKPGKIRRATSVLKMTVSAAKGRFVDASYRFAKILPDVCRVRASAQKRL